MLSASKIQESLKKMSELVNHALCVLQSKDAIVLLPAAAYHKPLKDELQKLLAATVDPLMVCADSYTVPVEYLMSAKCTPLFELERFISLYPSAVTQILDVYQRRAHQTYTLSLSLPTMFKNLRLECYDLNNSKLNNFFDQKGAIIKNQRRMGGYLSFMQVYHADLENKDKTEYEAKIYCFIQYAKTILKKNEQINFKRFLDETVKIFGSRLENVIETLKEKVEPKNEKLCEFLGYILEENRKAPIKAEKPPVLSAEVVESSSKEIESVFVTIQKNSKAILAVYAEKKLEKTLFHQYCTILKNIDVSPLINLSTHLNSSCLTKYIPKYLMSDKSKLLFDFLLFCCIHQQNLKEICDEQKMLFYDILDDLNQLQLIYKKNAFSPALNHFLEQRMGFVNIIDTLNSCVKYKWHSMFNKNAGTVSALIKLIQRELGKSMPINGEALLDDARKIWGTKSLESVIEDTKSFSKHSSPGALNHALNYILAQGNVAKAEKTTVVLPLATV